MNQEVYTASNGALPASVNDMHLACVLLLDVSGSMQSNQAIDRLNEAVVRFRLQCCADDALLRGLDIAVVTFASDVHIVQEFTPVDKMEVPRLTAEGQTSMGLALQTALDLLDRRRQQYQEIGVPAHRPWIFMISDGAPNDDWAPAFERVRDLQEREKVELWAVGVPGYDREILTSLTRRVIELDEELQFAPLLEWLSSSLSRKSASNPGELVKYDMLPEGSRVLPADWSK